MKRILGIVAVLAVTTTHASTELKFGDLNYFIPQGRVNVTADLNWVTEEVAVDANPGITKTETEGTLVNTKLGYAFADHLNFTLGLDYNYDVEVTPEGGSKHNADGLHNPELGMNYRVLNQNHDGFNLDFGTVISVGIEDEEAGAATGGTKKDGNAAKRSSLELNARLGNKWNEANEFYTIFGVVYNQSGEKTQRVIGGADVDSDLDSSTDVYLGAYYQYRPVNEFMMTLGAEARRVGVVEGDINGTDIEYGSHIDMKFSFTAKYLITETFIAKFNYTGARLADYTMNKTGAADTDFNNRRFTSMGLGVDFLF